MRQNTHFFIFLPHKATTQILPQNLTIIKPCALIFKAFLRFRRSADVQQLRNLFAAGDELHIRLGDGEIQAVVQAHTGESYGI